MPQGISGPEQTPNWQMGVSPLKKAVKPVKPEEKQVSQAADAPLRTLSDPPLPSRSPLPKAEKAKDDLNLGAIHNRTQTSASAKVTSSNITTTELEERTKTVNKKVEAGVKELESMQTKLYENLTQAAKKRSETGDAMFNALEKFHDAARTGKGNREELHEAYVTAYHQHEEARQEYQQCDKALNQFTGKSKEWLDAFASYNLKQTPKNLLSDPDVIAYTTNIKDLKSQLNNIGNMSWEQLETMDDDAVQDLAKSSIEQSNNLNNYQNSLNSKILDYTETILDQIKQHKKQLS